MQIGREIYKRWDSLAADESKWKMRNMDLDEMGRERKRTKKKKNERDWNLQRVTSLLLVWLGGGIAGCGDGCELKSSKFIICKQISSTSLLISAITSLHRNLVPVTEKNIHHRPRWTSNSAKTGRLFSSYWHKLIKRYESRKNSKSFESRINVTLIRVYVWTIVHSEKTRRRSLVEQRILISKYYNRGNYIRIR